MLHPETQQQQEALAAYCRTGSAEPDLVGVTPGRLPHYRRLVLGIVHDALASAYPVAKKYLGARWEELVEEFFAAHPSAEPQIWRFPHELLVYVSANERWRQDFPILPNLLQFEWLEVEVFMMENGELPPVKNHGDWLYDRLVFRAEHKLVALDYPVHTTPPEQITSADGPHYALLFREGDGLRVRFIALSALHVVVLEQLQAGMRLVALLPELSAQLNLDAFELQLHVVEFLNDLHQRGFVVGFQKN